MQDKINQIPLPQMNLKQRANSQERNRDEDIQNIEHTVQILDDRLKEAEECGDQKKKFHAIAVGRTQLDQFNVRERIRQLEQQYSSLKSGFSEEDFGIFIEFWQGGKDMGYSDSDIALYFKEMNLDQKNIVHFMNMLKIKAEMEELQKKCT